MFIARKNSPIPASPRSPAAALTLIACLWLAAPAWATLSPATTGILLLAQSATAMSADEAAALVRASSGGRILSVRRADGAHGPIYQVRVLLDGGRVRVYVVDASSGQVLQ